MPDTSHQRARADDIERYAPSTPGRGRGGVFPARNGKSYIVNIRPPKWDNKNKFWIGKIESFEWAQYVADALYFYCGKPHFHFKNANFFFPPLECIGAETGIPERLTTIEQFSKYVQSIAGKDFSPYRRDFLEKVERVIESDEFNLQRKKFFILRGNRMQITAVPREEAASLPSAARSREEAAALPRSALPMEEAAALPMEEAAASPMEEAAVLLREETAALPAVEASRMEDDRAYSETPVEIDDVSVYMVANLVNGCASSRATIAGFELNLEKCNAGVSEKSLHSVEESLERYYSLCDCPTGLDEGWDKAIEELNKLSSFGGSLNSAAVASTSNAPEVYQEGIKDISLTVFEGVSFSPGTLFVQSPDGSKVQVQSSANWVLCSGFGFASTAVHKTAEDEQIKNVKRKRIGG